MTASRRLWVPVLVGLLVAVLLGVPGSGDQAQAALESRAGGKIMIPAAAFIPNSDNWDFDNSGYYLEMSSGNGVFTAPLLFPVPVVNIKKIILYAYDNSGTGQVYAAVYRASPPTSNEIHLGSVWTTDSTANPQVVSTSAISPRRVNTALVGPYLWVTIGPGTRFFGVSVLYSY
ncbi:MAG: hypothetical protein ABIJ48_03835 [Actinomycetota bacterium]